MEIPPELHKMGSSFGKTKKLKFLTYWNALLQGLFFTICLMNDIFGNNEQNPKKPPLIRKIKDAIFTSLAFPLSMFVSVTFWGIYLVDRELIFPKILDKYFPVWLNHIMHTNIMVFVLLELVMSFRMYPTKKRGMSILTVFMLIYLIWFHIIYFYTGVWVYPILEVLNLPLKIVFYLSLLGFVLLCYLAGELFNNVLWSNQIRAIKGAGAME